MPTKPPPPQRPSTNSNSDLAVQATNDNSIVSKRSAERLGYFQEYQYLEPFIPGRVRRAPLINLAYFGRSLVVDYFASWFLDTSVRTASPQFRLPSTLTNLPKVVVSLGCGFDPSYFRIKSRQLTHPFIYVEIDYPTLVKRKQSLIRQNPSLSQTLASARPQFMDNGDIIAEDYFLIGWDLKNVKGLVERLAECGITPNHEILFVSEVALVYMDTPDADRVIRWAAQFPRAHFVLYEQTCPTDGPNPFSTAMVNHFRKMRAPLNCFVDYPSITDQCQRFQTCHWSRVCVSTLKSFVDQILTLEERRRIFSIEPFDEWEEWDISSSHYMVVFAQSNSASPVAIPPSLPGFIYHEHCITGLGSPKPESPKAGPLAQEYQRFRDAQWSDDTLQCTGLNIPRWGHTATAVASLNSTMVVFGGFGSPDGVSSRSKLTHKRLADPLCITRPDPSPDYKVTVLEGSTSLPCSRMYHTMSAVPGTSSIVLFGGRSGPLTAFNDVYIVDVTTAPEGRQAAWRCVSPGTPVTKPTKGSTNANETCDSATNVELRDDSQPCPRYRHAACVIPGDDPVLVIHGGRNPRQGVLGDMWRWNLATMQWELISLAPQDGCPRNVLPACYSHTMNFEPKTLTLWIIGGLTGLGETLASVYKICTRTWTTKRLDPCLSPDVTSPLRPSLPISDEIHWLARYGHKAYNLPWDPSLILIVGGITSTADTLLRWSTTWTLFDSTSCTFCYLEVPHKETMAMQWLCTGFDAVWLNPQGNQFELALVGGGATCLSFGSVFNQGFPRLIFPTCAP
ncbi:tRNA methyltransferase ppm2 [Dispira parvispora]|uniref:tRNA wybutosine-synthesizing protein 4 n=1 Tax=Dispira parvispora TaxID=1520584 RepID=A0A9W8AXW7_9FUNG|nr:tRNA methyltransferase ppm2 [Dispira parvispora]